MINKIGYTIFFLCFFLHVGLNAQKDSLKIIHCLTDNQPPEVREMFEEWIARKGVERKLGNRTFNSYTIPVVFHVIHNGEPLGTGSNISAAHIDAQLFQINQDFANQSGSTYSVAADIEIQFCLAGYRPDGTLLAEPGIERIDRNTKEWEAPPYSRTYLTNTLKPESIWNPDDYMNVWTTSIESEIPGYTILGFATFPTSSGLSGLYNVFQEWFNYGIETDEDAGICINYGTVGSNGFFGSLGFNWGRGRTLTHEIGHFLGLKHIWGDAPSECDTSPNLPECFCNTDYCGDTPTQRNPTTNSCPEDDQDENFKQDCPNIGDGTQRMFENYMDYSLDLCKNTYTYDQKVRMQTVMENSPRRETLGISNVCCSLPDLVVIVPSVNPATIVAGDQFVVSFAVQNDGRSSAGSSYVSFHLSLDATLTPGANGDIYLDEYFIENPISPLSQTILLNKTITLPGSVQSGYYYVFFSADGTHVIEECQELNNYATAILSITQTPSTNESGVRIWFDNNFSSATYENIGNYNNYEINGNVSTISLSAGLHTLNVQFKDTEDKWSSIVSSFFYKAVNGYPAGSPKYQYWFDTYSNRISSNIANTENLVLNRNINTDYISEGLHTFNIRFKPNGKHWSSITSSFVYKPKEIPTGVAEYEYWIDDDHSQAVVNNITPTDHLILISNINTDNISDGLHRFNIRFRPDGKTWSSITSSFFYKPKVIETGNAEYEYWIDNDYSNAVVVSITPTESFILLNQLNMLTIEKGLHVLHSRFRPDGKEWSSVTSSFFYKNDVIAENNISKCVYWFDNNWANYYTINLGNTNNVDAIIYANVDGLNEGEHTVSMFFNDDIGLWSSVVRDTFMKGENIINSCPDNQIFVSGLWAQTNTGYQWQLNDGSGFADISDNSYYSGTKTDTLILTDPPESWYGYQYRCIVSSNQGPLTSSTITLRFVYFWNGSVSSEWENPLNWDCQGLPGQNADVIINTGTVIVNSNPEVSSITIGSVVNFSVNQQKTITLTGH